MITTYQVSVFSITRANNANGVPEITQEVLSSQENVNAGSEEIARMLTLFKTLQTATGENAVTAESVGAFLSNHRICVKAVKPDAGCC